MGVGVSEETTSLTVSSSSGGGEGRDGVVLVLLCSHGGSDSGTRALSSKCRFWSFGERAGSGGGAVFVEFLVLMQEPMLVLIEKSLSEVCTGGFRHIFSGKWQWSCGSRIKGRSERMQSG